MTDERHWGESEYCSFDDFTMTPERRAVIEAVKEIARAARRADPA